MQVVKHTLYKVVYAVLLIAGTMMHLQAQAPVSREYKLKAAFVFNFCQFVEWPANAFNNTDSLVIGVFGHNPFGPFLQETVSGEKVGKRAVIVRYIEDVDEIEKCHLLFIADPYQSKQVLAAVKGKSVLTISDSPTFLAEGGIIRFVTRRNNIKFAINLDEAKSEGLVISSKLLRLADIYDSKNR
jgi:hypothetical protein